MTCDQLTELLDGYHAGELAQPDAQSLEQHLLTCEGCQAEFRFQRELRLRAAQLPRGVKPAANLWPGIQHRLTRDPRTARNTPWIRHRWMLAAAAVLLMGLASSLTALWMRHSGAPQVVTSTPNGFQVTEAAYREAVTDLAAALERRRASLAPAQIAVIEHNLRIIDDAIRETEAALSEQPGNRPVIDLLWASYEKKIDLLKRASSNVES